MTSRLHGDGKIGNLFVQCTVAKLPILLALIKIWWNFSKYIRKLRRDQVIYEEMHEYLFIYEKVVSHIQ